MNRYRRIVLLALAALGAALACSPIRPATPPRALHATIGERFSRSELAAEVDTMLRVMNDVHPDLYEAWPNDSVRAARDRLVATLPESLSRSQWWLRLSHFVAGFHDGHTNIGFPGDDVVRAEGDARLLAPGLTADADGHLRVTRPLEAGLVRGDRIVTINGRNADSLLAAWSDVSGEVPSFRAAVATGLFRDLLFLHGFSAPWLVSIARDDRMETVGLAGMTHDSLASARAIAVTRSGRLFTSLS